MNEWTDAQLDEDIRQLRGDGELDGDDLQVFNHYYGDFLEDIVVPREMIRARFFNPSFPARPGSIGEDFGLDPGDFHETLDLAGRMSEPDGNRNDEPKMQRLMDYEDALIARYLSLYNRDGEPTGVLVNDYDVDVFGMNRTTKFDEHIRSATRYDEQQWENVLGFHPVDLLQRRVRFYQRGEDVVQWNGDLLQDETIPGPLHALDALQNRMLKTWALIQTEGIVQARLQQEHNDMVEGALNFVQILDRSNKLPRQGYWVEGPDENRELSHRVSQINSRENSRRELGRRLEDYSETSLPLHNGWFRLGDHE